MPDEKQTKEAKKVIQSMSHQLSRLQELGFADPEESALGHSGGGGTCCQSGLSHGCTINTGTPKLASPG